MAVIATVAALGVTLLAASILGSRDVSASPVEPGLSLIR